MGKLNIAHHKSYHPYRLDNIERVRRDEAAAKLKETEDADRVLVADAESRLGALRSRAGITPPHSPPPGDRATEDPAPPVASGSASSSIPLSNGHINLFADLEEHTAALAARASKSKPALTDTDRGMALAPTKQDLNPWYSSSGPKDSDADKTAAARRQRDLARQVRADPLASIPSHLMRSSRTTSSRPPPSHHHPPPRRHAHAQPPQPQPPQPQAAASSSSREGRLARESSERERALALVRRKQRERERAESATATPSTVHGGYADVFNRVEVEDAHRDRDRAWRQRRWEDDAGIGWRPRPERH
ncbi:hypothetical protein EI94DRAFT_1706581 [Lactarius quietus]|nr:hypothetical protein EI94DRAFT_1706581 [Lactarius quietus]